MTDPVRLSKRLAEVTGCSRREADLYIEGGWVLVDGKVVEEPQFKVQEQRVELHPKAVLTSADPVTLVLYVPVDEHPDDTLASLMPADRWPDDASGIRLLRNHFARLRSCLELQPGVEGMYVLTQDWRTERKLTDDQHKLEQEYVVEVRGNMIVNGLTVLNRGFTYLGQQLPPCKVSWQNEIRLRFALKNPQPGQLKFMCESVGLKVLVIKRIRIGGVAMSKLQPGQWRYLAEHERF